MSETTLGTANILHQHTEYEKLKKDYSIETANELTAKSLSRAGIQATPNEVSSWHKINTAAVHGHLDIPAERNVAEVLANGAAGAIIASASADAAQQTFEDTRASAEQDVEDNDEDDVSNELPTIDEMYGYDDPEDNAEAALDDVLKAAERGE